MEIKTAKDKGESDTLQAARQSERWAVGLILGAAGATCVWFGFPSIRERLLPFVTSAGVGAGFVMKLGFVKIKNGRLSVGDLEEAVSNYALLPPGELKALNALKPVIEGNLQLRELPEVRSLVDSAIADATRRHDEERASFEEKIKTIEMKAAVFPKDDAVLHPPVAVGNFRSIKPEEVI